VTVNGDIEVGEIVIAAREIRVRTTTSGGPGGQHANRAQSRVVVSINLERCAALSDEERDTLVEKIGSTVSASSSTSRSQSENRQIALDRLARRLSDALATPATRTATRPTRASVERRIGDKKRRAATKVRRRQPDDEG
jgi:ribosome-associated protein